MIEAHATGGASLAGITITALPYDAPGLLDSLSRAHPDPPPTFPDLEVAMRAYRPAPQTDLGPAGRAWAATRDTAQRLADSLRPADRASLGYRGAYDRFRRLYDRLTDRSAEREEVLRSVTGEHRALAERAARAADSLRGWERRAYAAFDSLARDALAASDREYVAALTDSHGQAVMELEPGRWWLMVRLPHPENPFLEYAWEVGLHVRGRWPIRVPIFEGNAVVKWRY